MARRRKRRRIWLFSISFRVLAVIALILISLCYLAPFVSPAKVGFIGFFGIYFIPAILLNLILLIAAVIRRSRSFWIPVIALLPSVFFAGKYFRPGSSGKEPVPEGAFRIMSYNVGRFTSSGTSGQNECFWDVCRFIEEENPDIVLLQEYRTTDTSAVRRSFPAYRYVQHFLIPYRKGEYFVGNVTLSKFPIASGGRIRFESSTNMVMYSDAIVGSHAIRVYNVHLESNSISLTSLIKKIGGWEEFSDEFVHAHEKVLTSASKRQFQTDALLRNQAQCGMPSFICGDVNDTPMSYSYKELSEGKKDTFREAGYGFGATYSIMWPLLRIDYMFVPEEAQVYSHYTPKVKHSDHYPIVAEIGLE